MISALDNAVIPISLLEWKYHATRRRQTVAKPSESQSTHPILLTHVDTLLKLVNCAIGVRNAVACCLPADACPPALWGKGKRRCPCAPSPSKKNSVDNDCLIQLGNYFQLYFKAVPVSTRNLIPPRTRSRQFRSQRKLQKPR